MDFHRRGPTIRTNVRRNAPCVCEIRAVQIVESSLAWALHKSLWCVAVVGFWLLSHPQPPLSGTSVLWVLTGTHRCDDPGRMVSHQSARSCSALLLVFVLLLCGCHREGNCSRDVHSHPSIEHTCRGFRRLDQHLVSHRTLSICAHATASKRSHIHIHFLLSRTSSHFQATLTQSLCM